MKKLYNTQETLEIFGKLPIFEDMKTLYSVYTENQKVNTKLLRPWDCLGMMTFAYTAGLMQGKREERSRRK